MFEAPGTSPERELRETLTAAIKKRSSGSTRSRQTDIGPSEVGDACVRKLSYRMLGWEKTNTDTDPWASTSGTAIHAYLADVFKRDNDKKNPRWIIETKVQVTPTLAGSVDLFDTQLGMVIDHKCVGATSMKKARESGPSHQQLVQLNLYAYGFKQQGFDVKSIALAFYPFGGFLTGSNGLHTWVGEYDEQVALDAIERLDNIKNLVATLDPEANPDRWSLIPATPSYLCTWCPWFLPESTDLSKGCGKE
jgi:hypothetical protein